MSNEPTISEMNRAIAIFMEIVPIPAGTKRLGDIKSPEESEAFLNYHEKWELLMPVVVKIEKIESGRFGFAIDPWGIDIIDYSGAYEGHGEVDVVNVHREIGESNLLDDYYEAVTKFIRWHNQQASKLPDLSIEYRGPDSHCKACEEEKSGIKRIQAAKHTCRKKEDKQ